jgi:hypothetical protein
MLKPSARRQWLRPRLKLREIPKEAFKYCESLKAVTIPEGVKRIGFCAFECCKSLSKVSLPYGLEEIEEYAFNDCRSLSELTIPETVTSIGMYGAFERCTSLERILFPPNVNNIGAYYIFSISYLHGAEKGKPYHKNTIGFGSFDNCNKLTEFTVPDGVETIDLAFHGCINLEHLYLPASVRRMNDRFEDSPKLTIHAPAGSYAEQFAKENKIPFATEE